VQSAFSAVRYEEEPLGQMTLEDIQQAIANLPSEERAKLRIWLAEFEAGHGDREPETTASKLGRLAGRAVADVRKRMRES
jgi:hypothetical protein